MKNKIKYYSSDGVISTGQFGNGQTSVQQERHSKRTQIFTFTIGLHPCTAEEKEFWGNLHHLIYLTTQDTATWLSFQYAVLRGLDWGMKMALWLGPGVSMHVWEEMETQGNFICPPSSNWNESEALFFYAGQPKTCRKCGSTTHLAVNCEMTLCKNCRSGERSTGDCPQPRKCNVCGSNTHTFRDCPQSYANRTPQLNHDSEQVTIMTERIL